MITLFLCVVEGEKEGYTNTKMGKRKRRTTTGTPIAKKLLRTENKPVDVGDFVWTKLPSLSFLWPVQIDVESEEYQVYCKADDAM